MLKFGASIFKKKKKALLPINGGVPSFTAAPVLSGTTTQGQSLALTQGAGTGVASLYELLNGSAVVISSSDTGSFKLPYEAVGATNLIGRVTRTLGGQSVTETSNVLAGPVAAKVTGAIYPSTEANGTTLEALGPWTTVAGASGAIQTNGSGQFKKIATATNILILETGLGARTQSIKWTTTQVNTYSLVALATAPATGTVPNGYGLRWTSATQMDLRRYKDGTNSLLTLSGNTVTTRGVLEIRTEVAVDGSSVLIKAYNDGVLIGTHTDSSVNRITSGAVGLYLTLTGSSANIGFGIETYATDFAGGSGVVQSQALRIGRQTPAANGTMLPGLASLGLRVSGTIGAWEFIRTSGDAAKWPALVINQRTPAPIAALTDADADTSAVYQIRIDGELTDKNLTFNVQPIAEALPAMSFASNADIGRFTKASMGGKIAEFMQGCGDAWSRRSETHAVFNGFNTHAAGTFMHIRLRPGATKAPRGGLDLIACERIRGDHWWFEEQFPAWPSRLCSYDAATDTFTFAAHGFANGTKIARGPVTENFGLGVARDDESEYYVRDATANTFKLAATSSGAAINITASGTVLIGPSDWSDGQFPALITLGAGVKDVVVPKITVGAGMAAVADPTTWPSGISLAGEDVNFGGVGADEGVFITGVKDGIRGTSVNGVLRKLSVNYFCDNTIFSNPGVLNGFLIEHYWPRGQTVNPCDVGTHPDIGQFSMDNSTANWSGPHVRYVVTKRTGQGFFMFDDLTRNPDDPGIQPGWPELTDGEFLPPHRAYGPILEYVLSVGGHTHDIMMLLPVNALIKHATLIRNRRSDQSVIYDSNFNLPGKTEAVSGTIHRASGTMELCVGHTMSGGQDMVQNDVTLWGASGITDLASRDAYYAARGFADPSNDNAVLGCLPVLDGPLKVTSGPNAGKYRGALLPGAATPTWADGTPVLLGLS